ncbi:MAG: hypothetical protein VYA60_05000 [Pseudomonadota bacterium]|nr:hypothetical protein [Pseudomonadota bacterium]
MSRKNNSSEIFKLLDAKSAIEDALKNASVERSYCILRALKDETEYVRRRANDNNYVVSPSIKATLEVLIKTNDYLIHFYLKVSICDKVSAPKDLHALLDCDNSNLSCIFSEIDNDYDSLLLADFDRSQNIKLWKAYRSDATIAEIIAGEGKHLSVNYKEWDTELNKSIVDEFNTPNGLLSQKVKHHLLNKIKSQGKQFLNPEYQITPK